MKKLLLLVGLSTVAAAALAQSGSRVTPSYYSSYSKATVIGSLKSVQRTDGNYLTVVPMRQAPIVLEFGTSISASAADTATGVASDDAGSPSLNLSINSFIGAIGTSVLEVQMLDWNSDEWVPVYVTKTAGVSTVNVSVDPTMFVHPKTNMTRTRLVWTAGARIKAVGVDSLTWSLN